MSSCSYEVLPCLGLLTYRTGGELKGDESLTKKVMLNVSLGHFSLQKPAGGVGAKLFTVLTS